MFQGSFKHYALQDREVCGSCGSCFRSRIMRHCTPTRLVLAVLEGGVGATVAGAAAISIAAVTITAIGPTVVIAFDVALFSRAVKQLHEVVPERFNTWLLAAHRYFGKGFDDQALVVTDAAKEKEPCHSPLL